MKILLIDNYDSFTYNLYHYVSSLKCKVDVYRNDKIEIGKIKRNKYQKIIISPGPGNPNQAGSCLKIVKYFYKFIPILGVCLGHQIIGQIFGSKIVVAKKVMHGKISQIKHAEKGIFQGIKIMGVMHNKYNVHGVQFHPESIKTPEGMKLLKNFLKY